MKTKRNILLLLASMVLSLLAVSPMDAAVRYSPDRLVFNVHFRWDNPHYDPSYMGNAMTIDAFGAAVDSIGYDRIERIEIYSSSSPEGTLVHNDELTRKRAIEMRFLIFKRFNALRPKTLINFSGESWAALEDYVLKDKKMTQRSIDRIVSVIQDDSIPLDRKKSIMSYGLGNDPNVGDIYKYLYATYYPLIRNSAIFLIYLKPSCIMELPEVAEVQYCSSPLCVKGLMARTGVPMSEAVPAPAPAAPQPVQVVPSRKEKEKAEPKTRVQKPKETIFALKTNLLYDLVTMVNAEVEVPIGKRFSIMVEDVFPWWEFEKNKYALQNWEMGIEPRFWFKKWGHDTRKLLGHFVGPYAMSGRGDLQLDTRPNYQVHYWSAGITYGFCIPLGRKPWGHMEFSISAGMLQADYQHYQPSGTYDILVRDQYNSGTVSFFGPTKAKVSLVIPINVSTAKAREEAAMKEALND